MDLWINIKDLNICTEEQDQNKGLLNVEVHEKISARIVYTYGYEKWTIVMYTEYGASCNNHVHVLNIDFKKQLKEILHFLKKANRYAMCTYAASSYSSYYTVD